jgi:hypothetical protein
VHCQCRSTASSPAPAIALEPLTLEHPLPALVRSRARGVAPLPLGLADAEQRVSEARELAHRAPWRVSAAFAGTRPDVSGLLHLLLDRLLEVDVAHGRV